MSSVSQAGRDGGGAGAGTLLLAGSVLWLVATLLVGVAGDRAFASGRPLPTVAVFVATVPAMAVVAYAVYSWLDVRDGERPRAAALLVLPGLFLDAAAVVVGDAVGAVDGATTAEFAALTLVASAVVLLTGFVPRGVWDPEQSGAEASDETGGTGVDGRPAAGGAGTGTGTGAGTCAGTGPGSGATDGGTDG
jgi:hypothetical protein